jgi:hypothetical protein
LPTVEGFFRQPLADRSCPTKDRSCPMEVDLS